jgi:arginase family enzyme
VTTRGETPDLSSSPASADKAGTLIFTGLPSFMKAPWVACEVDVLKAAGTRAAFLRMPFDQATALRSGESYGPKGLRNISEMYLPYLGEFDVDLFEDFHLVDAGDVPVIPANAERSRASIEEYVGRVLDAGALPLLCGGDHSCPIPASRALTSRANGKVGYLHIDTHLDAAQDLQGELYTNWSTVSRITRGSEGRP